MERRPRRDEEGQDVILVDTSVWVDFLNGADSPQRHKLHTLLEEDGDIRLTGIILTEILQGIKEEKDFQAVKEYLLEFPAHEPKGNGTYLKAAGIFRECRKKGKTVRKTVDCVIAAVCMENGLTILHKDGDFDLIASCVELKVLRV